MPTNILAEHPDAANDPTLQKIAALKPTWVSKVTGCNGKTLINPGTMSSTGSFSMPVTDQGVQDRC
ncbi:hypothetical protein [Curtobacterium sp. VKM Ac-2922]|uniref:hypothetical protein n=1 Tax=Curtobacterium sp. VKM Ac-2922 TaxID=2929475 RepID=UPI001FB3658C|nr:hypothetical protein [Curtobacterium sp. VKM Ac-2922]MCJ1715760.1 hypothetical protein [Curtobacterium sp. VKM Ac-2922]